LERGDAYDGFVLFQVASAIKEGVIQEYALHDKQQIMALKSQVLNYMLGHPQSVFPFLHRDISRSYR
jgi:hypothetical protein